MRARRRPRVKVCCIGSIAEAWSAIDAGAAALGLVSAMPSGPGVIDDELAAEIALRLPPGIDSFLLTSRCDAEGILEQHRRIRTTTLQLVDRVERLDLERLRRELPGIRLVQVVHVNGSDSIDEARMAAPYVDAVLLDSGDPLARVKELGGTGRRHDWEISRQIRESLEVPIFLAGGLNPDNVRQAIDEVGPYGLDVCSGLRLAGVLDQQRLNSFFANVR